MADNNVTRRRVLRSAGAGLAATTMATGEAAASGKPERHVIGLRAGVSSRVAERAATTVHRRLDFGDIGTAVAGRFPEEALDALRETRAVRYVEKDNTYETLGQSLPWGVDRVDADALHGNGETGSGADIAIIDTGIDSDHPDLQGNLGTGKCFAADCCGEAGGLFCNTNTNGCNHPWDDDNDHGTHCAGTADAIDDSADVVGVATEATLHAAKALDGCGSGSLSDIADAIRWTADQGYDVASMSLGASSGDQTLQDACQYAYDNGVLLVAAAGNDGPCTDCVSYPAAYSTVMAVSATTKSMACPHVSGAGGQLMANGFTNTEARDRLQATAEDIGLSSNEQGNGLLDAENAVLTGFLVSTDSATEITGDSATLNGALNDLDGASSADVSFEYRETGTSSWTTTSTQTLSSTGSFSQSVSGLDAGTEYEFRAVGSASDGDTDTGGTVTFTTDSDCADATQWPAGSGLSGNEHLTTVDMDGQVVEASSDADYYDFTCPDVVTVSQGGSFDIAVEFEDAGYNNHYGNVYVDWDSNQDWSTATETQIMTDVDDDTVTYTATVNVPSDAATGSTLARVRLSWSQFYGPDTDDEYGEVEDFTVYVE
ncbi:serine protease [Halobacteriales archaeon QS_9_67_17]|nr:MAG: serine protease [Halobacteriales archaeon QS_9_67_17]